MNTKHLHCVGLLTILTALLGYLPGILANSTEAETEHSHHYYEQKLRIDLANFSCHAILRGKTEPDDGGLYCKPLFDDVMCWPDYIPANTLASRPCPDYVFNFNPDHKAFRRCTENGTWEENPHPGHSGEDYTYFFQCMEPSKSNVPSVISKHIPIATKISTIGYSISMAALFLAISIMVCFKKLHCQRNTIHINLFLSFFLRALISVVRSLVLVENLGLPSDIIRHEDGTIDFKPDGYHWECKLLTTVWIYALLANYFWIFVEGLYLHTLIFFAVFSQTKQFFKIYLLVGWAIPLFFIVAWLLTRIFHHDKLCWNLHSEGFYRIIEVPIILTICINFFFFLNIVRVLFTKIRDCNTRDPKRYKKLAKSTLVLIPMFGVYYCVFVILNYIEDPIVTVIYIYLELPISSIQGIVVAMLFCFFNGEVQAEILKRWNRHRLRSLSLTLGRSSRAFSTGSYTGRDRTSVCLGTISSHMASPGDSEGNGSTARTSVDHESLFVDARDGASTMFESIPLSDKHQSFPREPSLPRVSFQSQDTILRKNPPLPQTHQPDGTTKASPVCGKEFYDPRPAMEAHGSQNCLNGEDKEERLILIPSRNNIEHSTPASYSAGTCLPLVRGDSEFHHGEVKNFNNKSPKGTKGDNKNKDSRKVTSTNFNQLSALDNADTDESQPILK